MKKRLLAVFFTVVFFASACANAPNGGGNSANGSIGITRDDALLYAADSDRNVVYVVDAKTDAKVAEITVGEHPDKLLVGPDDTVYVANRMGRSVSVIRRGDTTEATRIDVAVEPVGLAVSTDGKTLYVVNAASLDDSEVGTLMAIDTTSRQPKWEVAVGHEPRGIALLSDDRAAVTLFKDGEVVIIDTAKHQVTKGSTGLFNQLNASALGITTPDNAGGKGGIDVPRPLPAGESGLSTAHARGTETVIPSIDGKQFYVASLVSSDSVLQTRTTELPGNTVDPINKFPTNTGSGNSGYAGGSCGTSAVAAPALLTFDDQGAPQVEDVSTCFGGALQTDRPPMFITSNVPGLPVQGPSALALDPTGSFLFMANRNSNNVAVVSTGSAQTQSQSGFGSVNIDKGAFGTAGGSVQELVNVGAGPSGVALAHQGSKAWVYNAFDHSISRLERRNGRVTNVNTVTLGEDVLSPEAVAGRRLFFSAVDARMNNPGTGIACATCHLEGREDGHVWNTTEGPRQTPSLAGRMTEKTAPFHWNGEFPDLLAFMSHTVTQRMGGAGVSPTMEKQVAAFIATIPKPDSAAVQRIPVETINRGREAFVKAQCDTCHTGETMTDNKFADVGTFVNTGTVRDNPMFAPKGLNTPSLLGVSRSAPFLHDGSAPTLRARIMQNKDTDRHGKTSQLSNAEVDDLVAYLKTL